MNRVTAIVPVRAGSVRIKDKNIQPFNGTTLLEHKLEMLKKVPEITRIVVSSDSEYMLSLAEKHGVDTHRRPIEFCDEKTRTFGDTVELICSNVEGDHILWAPCTSPLIYPDLFSKGINLYLDNLNNGFDSLISVELFKHFMWDDEKPLNYELGDKQVPSQQLPNYYVVTNGILISPRESTVKWKYTYGRNPYKFMIDKFATVDIDDEVDLKIAETLLEMNKEKFK